MTVPLAAPSVRRRLAVVAACSAAAVLTAGCTAHMDMTISPADTYDVVMEMRDTTGTVFTADTDCSAYANPELVGEFRGAQVSARAIGSVDDDAGVGCEVRVAGVAVPEASQATQGANLVVHDGDLYVVGAGHHDAQASTRVGLGLAEQSQVHPVLHERLIQAGEAHALARGGLARRLDGRRGAGRAQRGVHRQAQQGTGVQLELAQALTRQCHQAGVVRAR